MAGGQNLKKNISGNENLKILKILKIALNHVLNVKLSVEHDSKIRFLRSFREKKLCLLLCSKFVFPYLKKSKISTCPNNILMGFLSSEQHSKNIQTRANPRVFRLQRSATGVALVDNTKRTLFVSMYICKYECMHVCFYPIKHVVSFCCLIGPPPKSYTMIRPR